MILYGAVTVGFPFARIMEDIPGLAFLFSLVGLIVGFITGKLFEAAFFLGSCLHRRLCHGPSQPIVLASLSERIDEASTPLESPPLRGLPRQFGMRGLLIAVTWAAVLMGILRMLKAEPNFFFVAVTFVAGTMIAQRSCSAVAIR